MKNFFCGCFLFLLVCTQGVLAADIVGFWKTVDEKTGHAQSLVAIYEYQNKYYGRMIATYEDGSIDDTMYAPKTRAPGVVGHPFYSGMDFIWDLQPNGSKYTDGKILDPQRGRIYNAEAWVEDGNLIVRGKLLFFGRNQTWPAATEKDFPTGFKKPDLNQLVPSIPKVK